MKKQFCASAGLSDEEKDALVEKALNSGTIQVKETVERYLKAAEEIPVGWPQDRLIRALSETLAEDREVTHREENAIFDIADVMEYPRENVMLKLNAAQDKFRRNDHVEVVEYDCWSPRISPPSK